ncbi:unnamed protein product [Arabis nemorensis]|uniref:RING-type domain-containing protein n=1 Tax=Arabis nemorensis TaxID=586526 RepID=A0A565CCW0_9BRAS|nr:unnamed protein product [Arabis nemorensis]
MSTRYSTQLQSSAILSITVSSSSSLDSTPREENSHNAAVSESSPSSLLMRLAMRVSRARWFIFLRRVFHYQNGSRSDLGTNPFNSITWMISELIALLVQITVITFTLALSKNERPIWPVRFWITGYNVGCLLNLMLLYGRYRQLDISQGNGFGDIEQEQRGREDHTRCSHLMNRCRTSLELFFAIWFVIGNVWVFDSRFGSFHYAPNLHVLCITLLAWNALCYSFPFLLFLLLCCVVPLISSFLGYNMNMGSSEKGASEAQISNLPSWKYKVIGDTSDSANDPECCICLAKYKDKEEVRKLLCSHSFHLKCVDQWLRIISCCPLCKQDLPN